MVKKSGKFTLPKTNKSDLDIEPIKLSDPILSHFGSDSVSISLKYCRTSCECFSAWQKNELKKFSATISKISGYSPLQLQSNTNLCGSHKGQPSQERFCRPDTISDDIRFFEIKVDPSNKARIHGFFVGSVFFLVWLDRKHACFPE